MIKPQLLTNNGGKSALWAFKRNSRKFSRFSSQKMDVGDNITHGVYISEIALDPCYQLPFAFDELHF